MMKGFLSLMGGLKRLALRLVILLLLEINNQQNVEEVEAFKDIAYANLKFKKVFLLGKTRNYLRKKGGHLIHKIALSN